MSEFLSVCLSFPLLSVYLCLSVCLLVCLSCSMTLSGSLLSLSACLVLTLSLFLLLFPRNYRSKISSEETVMFCLRVMVGVIILYDHVRPVGAFVKTSNIDVRTAYQGIF